MCGAVLAFLYMTSWLGTLLNTTINLLLLVSQYMVVSLCVVTVDVSLHEMNLIRKTSNVTKLARIPRLFIQQL